MRDSFGELQGLSGFAEKFLPLSRIMRVNGS